jgi:hypothetical protein
LALFIFAGCSKKQSESDASPTARPTANKFDKFVKTNFPSLAISYRGAESRESDPYVVNRFDYKTINKDWLYGTGIIISNKKSDTPLWSYLVPGDFGPHSFRFVDFDKDGKRDLIFYAGGEDVYSTYVFLNKITSDAYSENNFFLVYQSNTDYSVLTDFDNDGSPELLSTGYASDKENEEIFCEQDIDQLISGDLKKETIDRYAQIVSTFGSGNFDYGMPAIAPVFNLYLFDPIKIYAIRGNSVVKVTKNFPEHLRWRKKFLEKVLVKCRPSCQPRIKQTIAYLNRIIEE